MCINLLNKKSRIILAFIERKCQMVHCTQFRVHGHHLDFFQKSITPQGMMQISKFFRGSSSFDGGQIIHQKLALHRYRVIEN